LTVAKGMDPNDKLQKQQEEKLEQVLNFERVVKRSVEKNDFETAVKYLDKVIDECPHSELHFCQKLEYLIKDYKLKEAKEFSS